MAIKISWSSETPKVIKNIRDGMITLFAGLIPFQTVISGWLHITTDTFTTICGVAILVVGVIAKMFGVGDTTELAMSSDVGPGGSTNPDPKGLPPKP